MTFCAIFLYKKANIKRPSFVVERFLNVFFRQTQSIVEIQYLQLMMKEKTA
jgi:hypothetical protein